MINQARTLLLNSIANDDPAPWDRYIPSEFRPLALPAYLDGVRQLLIPPGPWWDRTYQAELMLTLLASPRYAGQYSWLDDRVTPTPITPFDYTEPPVSITAVSIPGGDVCQGYILSAPANVPIKRTWQVTASGGSNFTVISDTNSYTLAAYESTANQGWLLPVAADFSLLFSSFGQPGDTWGIRAYKKPQNTFAQYPPILRALPAAWQGQLFNVSVPSEAPLNTYARWFKTCVHAEDTVAAVVLAYLLKVSLLL